MLDHSVLHVLQVLDGVDALPPVLAYITEGVLDVLDVQQGAVQLCQSCAYTIQLRLDRCLKVSRGESDRLGSHSNTFQSHLCTNNNNNNMKYY